MSMRLLCNLIGHQVNRKRVWDDSISYRTRCTRCGASLLKDIGDWRVFDPEKDSNPVRKPHPRFDKS